jgi:hypothetical protein
LTRPLLRFLLVAIFAIAGCQTQAQRHASGAELVSAYLRAAAGGDPLLGWSLLSSEVRDSFEGDMDRYLAVVGQADFSGLEWEVEEVDTEDDFLYVRVRAAQGTFPAYLSEVRSNRAIASGSGETREFLVGFGPLGAPELHSYGG